MTIRESLDQALSTMPDDRLEQVLDFAEYLDNSLRTQTTKLLSNRMTNLDLAKFRGECSQ